MDNNGNAIVVWSQGDGANRQIFKSEYRGGVWHHPASLSDNISPDGNDTETYSQVAMDNNGNAIIVWAQYVNGGSFSQIFKSEYRNGVWTNPASLSDYINPDGNAHSPKVAMDNNGNAIIVWRQHDGANYQLLKSEYRGGIWHHPASLSNKISPDGAAAGSPEIAMDNNGNAIIVWEQNSKIFKSEYRNGAWTQPASLSDYINPNATAYSPKVTMDNNGNTIIVWQQSGGIYKSEYRNDVWHHPASLSDKISPDETSTRSPKVTMDNNGNAIIVWEQYDSAITTRFQIFKSEYR